MRVTAKVWEIAMSQRGYYISEFLKYHGPTDAKAGVTLTELANKLGYSSRDKPVMGKTLRSWLDGGAPLWVIKTAVRFIIENGYIPQSDDDLDSLLAYVLIDVSAEDVKATLACSNFGRINDGAIQESLNRIWHAKL
ncbi:hypothetical protein G3489_19565 [Shewanella baltica]|uniref:hypothetical protein n=1 Tax=Shewanella baltica TaxID=62322 RepID=UPI00217EC828|nr:hypothetical protein [Shewanella baltica]MCS6271876.1 hypothetical protein [Shewanella baltica]